MSFGEPPLPQPRPSRAQLHEQIAVYATIKDVLPKLMALADTLESDVLGAGVCVLQREQLAIQAQWSGQIP